MGYLWLICVWLWFHDVLPQRVTASGAIADLYDLVGILPAATFLAALTFIAYFLGSIVELNPATTRWLDGVRPNRPSWEAVADRVRFRLDDPEDMQPERFVAAIAAWRRVVPSRAAKRVTLVEVELEPWERQAFASSRTLFSSWSYKSMRRLWRSNPGSQSSGTLVEWHGPDLPIDDDTVQQLPVSAIAALITLSDELPDLATRLLIERPEVFNKYDRLVAEASIRLNMFLPMVALVATLARRAHGLWWLALVVPLVLLYQGLVQRSGAIAVVLNSIATQLIESPTMAAVAAAQHGEAATSEPRAARRGPRIARRGQSSLRWQSTTGRSEAPTSGRSPRA
ncbi:hypothetical protein OOK27_50485 [Streptomyces canus]|uniref:hypothetical protein n=1 Tax=Streptomyces canus TaxID=58343 RepID=UPI002253349F|nr:hypothetical protein [Streptomyces canus]MCX5262266.1 hypothetical protein [Streptomyces canus]